MPTYAIHNTVRSRSNRALRATQPVHHRLKHHIGDGQRRLIRGRPIFMEEDEFLRNLDELKAKAAVGILEVRTPDGVLIDLETLKPESVPAPPPLPKTRLDSIAHDAPWGQPMPPMPGDEPPSDGPKEPTLLSELEPSNEEDLPWHATETPPPDAMDAGEFEKMDEETTPEELAPTVHGSHPPAKKGKGKR